MSRQIDRLKQLLNTDEDLRGTVTEISNDLLFIATKRGLKKFPTVTGVKVGDKVLISSGSVTILSSDSLPTYFV